MPARHVRVRRFMIESDTMHVSHAPVADAIALPLPSDSRVRPLLAAILPLSRRDGQEEGKAVAIALGLRAHEPNYAELINVNLCDL